MTSTQSTKPAVTPERILQTGLGFWASRTLLSAVELGLFTELAKQPLPVEKIAERFAFHSRGARDFLDALVALRFLDRSEGMYRNTAETDLFLDREKPSYVGGILEMAGLRLYGFWGSLTDALRTGQPQNEFKTGGPSLFDALYADPQRLEGFLKAMTSISGGSNRLIASRFPWQKYRTYVDVGTAQGDLAVQIGLANPHLSGSGMDLPQVRPIFEAYASRMGVSDRVSFTAGSFFTDPIPKADVVLMGHILHDWDLEQKKMLIRKAWEALPAGGSFVVYEALIDDERSANAFGLLMSLNMLIETPGGFDFTGADCRGWMLEAGFTDVQVEPLVGADAMLVAIK